MLRFVIAALLGTAALSAAAPDRPTTLKSTPLVSQLTAALTAQKLAAIAAKDPNEPDRFVAAQFYAGSQLLVISARASDPATLETRLLYKQYGDIYVELQGRPVRGSSLFVQDMKADGLPEQAGGTADIVYRGDGSTIVLDHNWRNRGISEETYRRQLEETDSAYAHALAVLLAQLKPT